LISWLARQQSRNCIKGLAQLTALFGTTNVHLFIYVTNTIGADRKLYNKIYVEING
jgi:hypothetical protein